MSEPTPIRKRTYLVSPVTSSKALQGENEPTPQQSVNDTLATTTNEWPVPKRPRTTPPSPTFTVGKATPEKTKRPSSLVSTPKDNSKPLSSLIHGNYSNYYGYRHQGDATHGRELDPRLMTLEPDWVTGKRVLDIGCNAGFVTTSLALNFHPLWAVGVDIDENLVQKAKRHLNFVYSLQPPHELTDGQPPVTGSYFPISMPLLYGNIPVFHESQVPTRYHHLPSANNAEIPLRFPSNVFFHAADWVKDTPKSLPPTYDLILALSITKWIHLNQADEGLGRFFAKVFQQLAPGGRFILEPQPFRTYYNTARKYTAMRNVYQSIKLKPEEFPKYLLETVGFQSVTVLHEPRQDQDNGFDRPIYMFTKAQ
ncbi:hypothetical protein IWQ62_001931 [Dispira parvispora]|uniref:RNA methyltransferase n=1 Tax=Dispira parvispora TaxID=1520584 RepID=A0A9W8AX81_9FUNG|nr:hypothetical protein IWQ62_001931 [Dispira parvispora]